MLFVLLECVDSFEAIKTGKLTTTSAWEVHDCCTATPLASASVFQCIRNIGGLCSESAYPRSKDNCGNNTCSAVATVRQKSYFTFSNSFKFLRLFKTAYCSVHCASSHPT